MSTETVDAKAINEALACDAAEARALLAAAGSGEAVMMTNNEKEH